MSHVRVSRALRERFPSQSGEFDAFEELADAWQARFKRGETIATGADRLHRVTGGKTARRLVAVQGTNLAGRIVGLSAGLLAVLESDHAQAAPPVARAVFETCGVSTYMRDNLTALLEKSRPERAKVMLFRLGLGTDPGTGWGRLKPYRVSAFVKSLIAEAERYDTDAEAAKDGPRMRPWDRPFDARIRCSRTSPIRTTRPRSLRCGYPVCAGSGRRTHCGRLLLPRAKRPRRDPRSFRVVRVPISGTASSPRGAPPSATEVLTSPRLSRSRVGTRSGRCGCANDI